jgi:hypothetical protein
MWCTWIQSCQSRWRDKIGQSEWINEVKLSPTLLPESDEEYVARRDDEDMDRTTHMRH